MSGSPPQQPLTDAQQELYDWLADYIGQHRHSPSIRQMMEAMGLRSPAPVQSRLRHLQQKGWITWQEGQARTLQLLGGLTSGIPVLGAVAAGGLVETFDDVQERLAMPRKMFDRLRQILAVQRRLRAGRHMPMARRDFYPEAAEVFAFDAQVRGIHPHDIASVVQGRELRPVQNRPRAEPEIPSTLK